ncbi:MAG: Crp/Fnr family transcriptional regulator [Bacteroidetes bacterium]|nr:Crp/Fnr family transcriptional regulator [Bacteroidota bacterium]
MHAEEAIPLLISHFRKTVSLNEMEIAEILPRLDIVSVDKKKFLLQPGQVSRHMRFVASGCMRSFYVDENNQEHTLQLGIENWWINDLYSYLSQQPSRMFLQAVENTVLIQISKNNLEELFRLVPAISDFFRIKIQAAYVALQERTIENMSVDAYERYTRFRSDYRDIEQRVPQYIIASYLGVTPEFLSHLRKKQARNDS